MLSGWWWSIQKSKYEIQRSSSWAINYPIPPPTWRYPSQSMPLLALHCYIYLRWLFYITLIDLFLTLVWLLGRAYFLFPLLYPGMWCCKGAQWSIKESIRSSANTSLLYHITLLVFVWFSLIINSIYQLLFQLSFISSSKHLWLSGSCYGRCEQIWIE